MHVAGTLPEELPAATNTRSGRHPPPPANAGGGGGAGQGEGGCRGVSCIRKSGAEHWEPVRINADCYEAKTP